MEQPGLYKKLGSILKFYLRLLTAWVLAFLLFKLVLVVATWKFRGDAGWELLLGSILHGLRFDFSMAVRISALFALWRVWRPELRPIERRIFTGMFSVVALLSFFTLTAEVEYYKEFQMRLGPLALEYFGKPEDNKTIAGMIWHGYPVVRWTTFCIALWAIFVWLNRKFLTDGQVNGSWPAKSIGTVVIVFVTIFGSRGGFQSAPLRWGDSLFSQNTYANHMAQNGVFALVDTLRSRGKSKKSDAWSRAMPHTNALAMVREFTLLPGETLLAPDKRPLVRRSRPSTLPILQKPKNVVLILMESFSARFCGATGANFGATPNFDALARQGILFNRAFSVSTHTAQGVFGTLCSFPNLPEFDGVMKHPLGNQPFRALPTILKESGFSILFLYNGLYSWDNKEGFFRQQGVERFIGRNDYVNPTFVDPDWGVCDFDVFMRAVEEFNDLAKTKKPFFGFILTLSNHAPFNLPKVEGLEHIPLGEEQNKRVNGVHYADWALGQFMARARETEWFNDTLFVLAGDHGFGIPPVLTRAGLLHHHIPLLFYGPGVLGQTGEVRQVAASQLDILPTIHGILGLEVPHQSFGRNLFSLPPGDPGRAYVKASGSPIVGLIEGNEIITTAPGQRAVLQTFDLSFPPTASDDLSAQNPERAALMENRVKALVQIGLKTLKDHHAGKAE